jgi:FkbM family methyltransferase
MRTASRLRYLAWRATPIRRQITLRLRGGERIVVRPPPSGDLSVAFEIFVAELYRSPRPLPAVSRIVDVGANVGFSVTYLARRFPTATVTAFEPHPAHLLQLARNVKANHLGDRVTVIPAAAGAASGRGFLSDAGECSRLVLEAAQDGIEVPIADFFAAIGDEPIDLLKMDCEGGEHALVMDDRFAALRIAAIVLEWHAGPYPAADETRLQRRLLDLGFEIETGTAQALGDRRWGMLWAYHRDRSRIATGAGQ